VTTGNKLVWHQSSRKATKALRQTTGLYPSHMSAAKLWSTLCSQIMQHLEEHSILSDAQHGFRKRRSCETQLLLTLQDLSAALDNSKQINAILLDFSTAFDKVPYERLGVKLCHYGIRGNILAWIKSFLSNRTQQVLVEGVKSSPAPVTSGVSQVSVLGPLLFLVYINDMPARVKSTTRLLKDDSLLYRKIRCPADTQTLQEDLNTLQEWEQTWKTEFNPSKCEVLLITRKRNPIQATYSIHGHQLANVKTGKYIGVTFASDLSWKAHVDARTKSANSFLPAQKPIQLPERHQTTVLQVTSQTCP